MRRTVFGTILALMTLAGPQYAESPGPITISIDRYISFEPAAVWVTLTVERDDLNRALTFVADGPAFYQSSSIDLDGQRAAKVHRKLLRELPSGDYVLRAILTRADGSQPEVATKMIVIGMGSYPDV